MLTSARPSLTIDLYSDDALAAPLATYRAIRDAGPAVWLPRHRLWEAGRYADVKKALREASVLTSGAGVAANPVVNASAGTPR